MSRLPRVLVTRHRLQPLGAMLTERGMQPVHVPLAELVPTGAPPPAGAPALVLLNSATAVERCSEVPVALGSAPVVAVGPATARAAAARGLKVAAVGGSDATEAVARLADLAARRAGPVWVVGAAQPSRSLRDALAAWGHPVEHWRVYRRRIPPGACAALDAAGPVDAALFTASSAVETWAACRPPPVDIIVAIGRSTAATLEAHGVAVDGVPGRPSLAGAAELVARLLRTRGAPRGG